MQAASLCGRVIGGFKSVCCIKLPGIIAGLEGAMLLICPNGPWLRFGSKPDTSTLKIEKLHRPVSGKAKKVKGTLANVRGCGKMTAPVPIVQVLIHQWRTSFLSCILCGCIKWHHCSMCRAVSFIELHCNLSSVCSAALHVCPFGQSYWVRDRRRYWSNKLGLMYARAFWENCISD